MRSATRAPQALGLPKSESCLTITGVRGAREYIERYEYPPLVEMSEGRPPLEPHFFPRRLPTIRGTCTNSDGMHNGRASFTPELRRDIT